jgi:hypothetical protein
VVGDIRLELIQALSVCASALTRFQKCS